MTRNTATIKIAIICRQYINCKWYQLKKKRKLWKQATEIAKEYNIEL